MCMLTGKIGKGVQATEAAKAAVAKIEKAVRREVITPDKLVRTPASDLYDKSCYMNTEKFWKDNEVFAGVADRLNITNNLPMISKKEPTYPIPSGFRYYTRNVINMDKFKPDYYFIKREKLLEQGDLQKYVDKMRRLAKYKENMQ